MVSPVLDDYGFAVEPKFVAEYEAWRESHRAAETETSSQWIDPSTLPVAERRPRLEQLCVAGFPSEHRALMWALSSGAARRKEACDANCQTGHFYAELLEQNRNVPRTPEPGPAEAHEEFLRKIGVMRPPQPRAPPAFYEIWKDLRRTFPGHAFFATPDGELRLRNVLEAFARFNDSIGYCQGMNFVAGWLLLVTGSDEAAFYLLVQIVEHLCAGVYSKSMVSIQLDTKVLETLLDERLPAVAAALRRPALEGALNLLVTKWFICLFISILPSETMLRVWDQFFLHGQTALLTAALALLDTFQLEVRSAEDIAALFEVLQLKLRTLYDGDALVQAMSAIELTDDHCEALYKRHRDSVSAPAAPIGRKKPEAQDSQDMVDRALPWAFASGLALGAAVTAVSVVLATKRK
eukprot:TRINITY_DN23067_c0_g1_i1.p1 TRINITY_DN23067_c0_g1~~TRINITY_DN23067_c0_g1_i1.p1  ORF type:complete len:408 (-),score=141.10 TRINITY_DN23067_c0_g1_i1:350-1573(-)